MGLPCCTADPGIKQHRNGDNTQHSTIRQYQEIIGNGQKAFHKSPRAEHGEKETSRFIGGGEPRPALRDGEGLRIYTVVQGTK